MVLPPGGREGSISLEVCYSGPQQNLERALAPLRKLGAPASDTVMVKDFVEVQRSNDTGDSRSLGTYLKGGFISQAPDKLVTACVDGFVGHPERVTILYFQHCGGATSRQPENATAFAQRDSLANMLVVTGWPHGKVEPAEHMQAARTYWSTLEPFTRGFYINDTAREVTSKDINSNYRGNYPRMLKLKQTYDPTNLFRLNANVQPKVTNPG